MQLADPGILSSAAQCDLLDAAGVLQLTAGPSHLWKALLILCTNSDQTELFEWSFFIPAPLLCFTSAHRPPRSYFPDGLEVPSTTDLTGTRSSGQEGPAAGQTRNVVTEGEDITGRPTGTSISVMLASSFEAATDEGGTRQRSRFVKLQ